MSFSTDVKQEVSQITLTGKEGRAELSALIQMCSSLSIQNKQLTIIVKVENAAVARTIYQLIKDRYQVEVSLVVSKKMNLRKNKVYGLRILKDANMILEDLGLYSSRGLLNKPLKKIVDSENCARAYLAGAFLSSGSISPPEKANYHLEITAVNEDQAGFLQELMARFNILARTIERRGKTIVYVKAAEKIGDFLRVIGANQNLLEFENVRISRDFTNNLSRLNNIDVANEMKVQSAAKRQICDVKKIQDNGYFEELEESLQGVCLLRMNNPEASLQELADLWEEKTGETLSKSGMKHRFNRIHEIAERGHA